MTETKIQKAAGTSAINFNILNTDHMEEGSVITDKGDNTE